MVLHPGGRQAALQQGSATLLAISQGEHRHGNISLVTGDELSEGEKQEISHGVAGSPGITDT
jgi:hypothetical protein